MPKNSSLLPEPSKSHHLRHALLTHVTILGTLPLKKPRQSLQQETATPQGPVAYLQTCSRAFSIQYFTAFE